MNQHEAMNQDEVDEFMATAWPLLQQVWAKVTQEAWPIPNLDEVNDIRAVTEDLRKYTESRAETLGIIALERGLLGISAMADSVPRLAEWEAENGSDVIPGITEWIRGEGERAIAALTEIVQE